MSTLYYANADFDYRIGGLYDEAIAHRVRLWHLWFLVLGGADDFVYVPPHALCDEVMLPFSDYLRRCGVGGAEVVSDLSPCRADDLFCFGYDENARLIAKPFVAPAVIARSFSSADAVKAANSKIFCARLLQKRGDYIRIISPGELLDSIEQLGYPAVVKKSFGSSSNASLIARNKAEALALLTRKDIVNAVELTVDRWYTRSADYSAGFTIDREGHLCGFNLRRLYNSARGIFSMVRPLREDDAPDEVVRNARSSAQFLSDELTSIGYFGPVNFDFFSWQSEDGSQGIRPFCDINARNSMATVGAAMASRLGACDYALASFNAAGFAGGGVHTYTAFESLAARVFDACGVHLLLVSPLTRKGVITLLMYSSNCFDELRVRALLE